MLADLTKNSDASGTLNVDGTGQYLGPVRRGSISQVYPPVRRFQLSEVEVVGTMKK